MKTLLLSAIIFFAASCATEPLTRVKTDFCTNWGKDISCSTVDANGVRKDVDNLPMEKWTGLKGWVALPVENYNKIVNRQNL